MASREALTTWKSILLELRGHVGLTLFIHFPWHLGGHGHFLGWPQIVLLGERLPPPRNVQHGEGFPTLVFSEVTDRPCVHDRLNIRPLVSLTTVIHLDMGQANTKNSPAQGY